MSGCCEPPAGPAIGAYRRVLYIVIAINGSMFAAELGAGLFAQSVALQADALDFFGDTVTYAITLMVLAMSLRWRARAALLKGATMGLFGLWVIGQTVYHALLPGVPVAAVMGAVGLAALVANLVSAVLLYRHRGGDANMRSVWLCSRNDALGNLAVVAAASGVFATDTAWPDLAVGAGMAALALTSCWQVVRQASAELRTTRHAALTG